MQQTEGKNKETLAPEPSSRAVSHHKAEAQVVSTDIVYPQFD